MAPANPSVSGMACPVGSTRAGSRSVPWAWTDGGAADAWEPFSAGWVNVAGMDKIRHRLGG